MDPSTTILQKKEWDLLGLGEAMLRLARADAEKVRANAKVPELGRLFVEARNAASRLFRSIDEEVFEEEHAKSIAELAASYEGSLGVGTTARAIALGLDDALGDRFEGILRGETVGLEPNSACPVSRPPLKDIYGHLCTDPDRASEPIDRTPRLCLTPSDMAGIRINLDFTHEDHFSRIRHGAKLGVALPNSKFDELTLQRFSKGSVPLFYGVGPRDPAEQGRRVKELLDAGAKAGVDVVVLPELCTDAQVLADVRTWRSQRAETAIPVILAGSRHIDRNGDEPGENEAVVVFATGEEAAHRKIAPYIFRDRFEDDGSPSATDIERREFIGSTSNTITIHYSGDWSLAVVICKDLLETAIVRALEDLRVRLVLVPACSEKTDLLEQHAGQLGRSAQATVIVANLPTGPEAACAIFSTPMKSLGIFRSPVDVIAKGPVVCVLEILPTPQVKVVAI